MFELSSLNRTLVKHGLSAFTALFLILWLQIRPLCVFFLVVLTIWLYQTQCNVRILASPEVLTKFEQLYERGRNLRQTQPKMFYAMSFVCLSSLALLGHLVTGLTVTVCCLLLAAFFTAKYRFKFVKMEPIDFGVCMQLQHDPDFDDEFLIEENESNLCVLDRASDLATLSSHLDDGDDADEDKSDEVPSELLIPDVIPEIDETYTDEDEDVEDLVPIVYNKDAAKAAAAHQKLATSEDSNSQNTYEMEFKKGHFKRDSSLSTTSSSSDEENLSKGLKFPDHTMVDGASTVRQRQILPPQSANSDAADLLALAVKSQSQALLQTTTSLLPSLLSGLGRVMGGGGGGDGVASNTVALTSAAPVTGAQRVVTALDSSDESDFEILESDDFK